MILKQILVFQDLWIFKNLFPNQFSYFNNIFLLMLEQHHQILY